jgi:hypothetical protein
LFVAQLAGDVGEQLFLGLCPDVADEAFQPVVGRPEQAL